MSPIINTDGCKVKVLTWRARDENGSAEDMLNAWLALNAVEIVFVSQSETGNVTANHRITYTIWYRETA